VDVSFFPLSPFLRNNSVSVACLNFDTYRQTDTGRHIETQEDTYRHTHRDTRHRSPVFGERQSMHFFFNFFFWSHTGEFVLLYGKANTLTSECDSLCEHTHTHTHTHRATVCVNTHTHTHRATVCVNTHTHTHRATVCVNTHTHTHRATVCEKALSLSLEPLKFERTILVTHKRTSSVA